MAGSPPPRSSALRSNPPEPRGLIAMSVLLRNNVTVSGDPSGPPMLFAHGFGCDQNMWRLVAQAFEATHRVVPFDQVGFGASDHDAWSSERYATLDGYAEDVLDICRALELEDIVFVGHSVSAMIGVIVANAEPPAASRKHSPING